LSSRLHISIVYTFGQFGAKNENVEGFGARKGLLPRFSPTIPLDLPIFARSHKSKAWNRLVSFTPIRVLAATAFIQTKKYVYVTADELPGRRHWSTEIREKRAE